MSAGEQPVKVCPVCHQYEWGKYAPGDKNSDGDYWYCDCCKFRVPKGGIR